MADREDVFTGLIWTTPDGRWFATVNGNLTWDIEKAALCVDPEREDLPPGCHVTPPGRGRSDGLVPMRAQRRVRYVQTTKLL